MSRRAPACDRGSPQLLWRRLLTAAVATPARKALLSFPPFRRSMSRGFVSLALLDRGLGLGFGGGRLLIGVDLGVRVGCRGWRRLGRDSRGDADNESCANERWDNPH